MSIGVCVCQCNSSEMLARQFLKGVGYPNWLDIPIEKGKERSLRMLEYLPNYPEVQMLRNYLQSASKWVIIVGWNEKGCRWADITHSGPKAQVDAQLVVETFSDFPDLQ